ELSLEQIRIFEGVAHRMLTILGYPLLTDVSQFILTETDIAFYEKENARGMEEALRRADPEDILRRKPQEDLLKQIESRVLQ
ncbi:MAG: hypothetical protein ACK4RF_05905, partial [Cyclobacteriaceae bacterium]